MSKYLSAIKTKLLILGLDVAGFADIRLKYYQKAIPIHAPMRVNLNKVIDIPLLRSIVHQCDYTFMGKFTKHCICLVFFFIFKII